LLNDGKYCCEPTPRIRYITVTPEVTIPTKFKFLLQQLETYFNQISHCIS
jgi:hypothetical protein